MSHEIRPSDPGVRAVKACRWRFESPSARTAFALNVGPATLDTSIGLFEDTDEAALLGASWSAQHASLPWPPQVPTAALMWTSDAEVVSRWSAKREGTPGCLVVVRQPLIRPDRAAQRDWVATVLRALDGDPQPPPGLLTASFFASRDGEFVLNFAEWTSASAHLDALARGSYGRHGSIGSSSLWKATREHPAITAEHEVHRYVRMPRPSAATRAGA
jgi:hypothetical protein